MKKKDKNDLILAILGLLLYLGIYIYIGLTYGKEIFWLLFLIELVRNIGNNTAFIKKR